MYVDICAYSARFRWNPPTHRPPPLGKKCTSQALSLPYHYTTQCYVTSHHITYIRTT